MSSRMDDNIFKELSWLISSANMKCCKKESLVITKWDPGQGEAVVTCDKCMKTLRFTETELLAVFANNPFAVEHSI